MLTPIVIPRGSSVATSIPRTRSRESSILHAQYCCGAHLPDPRLRPPLFPGPSGRGNEGNGGIPWLVIERDGIALSDRGLAGYGTRGRHRRVGKGPSGRRRRQLKRLVILALLLFDPNQRVARTIPRPIRPVGMFQAIAREREVFAGNGGNR